MITRVPEHVLNCVSGYVFSRHHWSIAYLENSPSSRRTTRGDYKDSLERAFAKTLKGLKTTNPDRDARAVCRSLAIIYEFGAPKKAMAAVGPRQDWAKCALRISNRSAKRTKYFMENELFNGPYGRWSPFMSALICSQRGPYRLPPKQLVPWLDLGRSRYRNPFVASESGDFKVPSSRIFWYVGLRRWSFRGLLTFIKKSPNLVKKEYNIIENNLTI